MAYDKNGNYLKTLIQNRSFNMEFNVLENSIIISDGRTVSLYDKQGKLENEIRISPFDSISFGTSNHLSDFSSQEVIFSCPGSDTLYFLGKSGITRKISLDYGHNQSPEQFKKSLSNPITFPYFHNFISLGKTVLDLIVIDQKQYMIQLDPSDRHCMRYPCQRYRPHNTLYPPGDSRKSRFDGFTGPGFLSFYPTGTTFSYPRPS